MTSMPLTLRTMLGVLIVFWGSFTSAVTALVNELSSRAGPGMTGLYQDWQSAGVRGVNFLSAAYLAAVDFTSGLMICSSPCSQSDVNFHCLPSHVWMRAHDEPMWSTHDVLIGRITPAKPSASSLACV